MKPYIGIVHKDENSAYGVTFPDAPGCFSAADELKDVPHNAAEALRLWADGIIEDEMPIQEPRTLEELRQHPCWAEQLASAHGVIGCCLGEVVTISF